jgi:hypothetical protein
MIKKIIKFVAGVPIVKKHSTWQQTWEDTSRLPTLGIFPTVASIYCNMGQLSCENFWFYYIFILLLIALLTVNDLIYVKCYMTVYRYCMCRRRLCFRQGCGSVFIFSGSGSGSRVWCWRPIRIQGFNDQKLKKKLQLKIFFYFFCFQKLQFTYP